jgi:hypothetical protein
MKAMMKQRWLKITIVGVLTLGCGVVLTLMFNLSDVAQPTAVYALHQLQTGETAALGADTAQLAGDYSGDVQLQFTVAGVYSDTLAAPPPPAAGTPEPPDLGAIDLALSLSQDGSTISGYVNLEKTLVFTDTHTIQKDGAALKIGPYVNGSFDGTNLTLVSEQVATTLSGQPIQRQFRLSGAISMSDGSQITGEYRETLWGATSQPVTVLGTFTLQRPVWPTGEPEPGNKAPDTAADTATTTPGTAVTINVLENDTDPNGDALTVTGVSRPQFGQATTNGQSVTYRSNPSFRGVDTFTYFVSDSKGGTAANSVTVTVSGEPGNYLIYLPLIVRQ